MANNNTNPILVAAGAALGSSPPTSTVPGPSDDNKGKVLFGSGSSPTTGVAVTLTLSGCYSSTVDGFGQILPSVSPLNSVTAALGLQITTVTANSFAVSCTSAPAASQGATTYQFSYEINV